MPEYEVKQAEQTIICFGCKELIKVGDLYYWYPDSSVAECGECHEANECPVDELPFIPPGM